MIAIQIGVLLLNAFAQIKSYPIDTQTLPVTPTLKFFCRRLFV